MSIKHAVLCDPGEILFMEDRRVRRVELDPEELRYFNGWLGLAARFRIDKIWIQPGSKYTCWPVEDLPEAGWEIRKSTWRKPREKQEYLRNVSARQGRTWVTVTWPEWTAYEWRGKPSGIAMLACFDYLPKAFDVPLDHNPGVMGRALMEKLNAKPERAKWIEQPDLDLLEQLDEEIDWSVEGFVYNAQLVEQVEFRGDQALSEWEQEQDLLQQAEEYLAIWKEQHGIRGKVYLHGFDINSQHPGAMKVTQMPCGDPELVTQDFESLLVDEKGKWRPPAGMWHIKEIDYAPGSFLVDVNPLQEGQEWVTTPLFDLLHRQAQRVVIDRAWIWREQHLVFNTWAQDFWDARQSLRPNIEQPRHLDGLALAYYSAKRIGAASVGLLKSSETKQYNPQWYQPHRWRFIVEGSTVIEYWNLEKVWHQYLERPILVVADMACYLSSEPDPALAFPGHFGRADKLGGWKSKGEDGFPREATPEVIACVRAGWTPGMCSAALKGVL